MLPIIQGRNADSPTDEFTSSGLSQFKAGERNVTELRYHDCDEFFFMIEGKLVERSEGVLYTLEQGDAFATRMSDEHKILEILEDTLYFWLETERRAQKRPGHLHRHEAEGR